MKLMKKDVVMTVGSFPKNISHDLKKSLRITFEGILYSGGVKFKKFQLVSKIFNWYLKVKYDHSYIIQREETIKVK